MLKAVSLLFTLGLPLLAAKQPSLDLQALVAQADRYELPKPPADSKLVLIDTGSSTGSNGARWPIYDTAFLIRDNGDGTAMTMAGFRTLKAEPWESPHPLILPFNPTPPEPKPGSYVFWGDSMDCFATAIQLARRCDLKNAKTLATRYLNQKYNSGFKTQEAGHRYSKNPALVLARVTFEFYYQRVREKDADLGKALRHLENLQTEFPSLYSKDPKNSFAHYRTQFVEDLRLTVELPPPQKDSIEDLLMQLSEVDPWEDEERHDELCHRIYHQGVAAIPELVRLCTSRKLTTAINHGMNNAASSRVRLAQLAGDVLEDMVGAHDNRNFRLHVDPTRKEWLEKTDLSNEKQFFMDALSESIGRGSSNDEIPLTILLHRHPESALELAEKIVERNRFLSLVKDLDLGKAEKLQCLMLTYPGTTLSQRRSRLWHLAAIDPEAAQKEILIFIASIPQDVSGAYADASGALLAYTVARLNTPVVWRAFLHKTNATSVGLRMEILKHTSMARPEPGAQNLRLAFLAAFLTDPEVRAIDPFDERWSGRYAGSDFDSLSVQDFAASRLGSILKIPGEPSNEWTGKQWLQYRKAVTHALSRLELPGLSN